MPPSAGCSADWTGVFKNAQSGLPFTLFQCAIFHCLSPRFAAATVAPAYTDPQTDLGLAFEEVECADHNACPPAAYLQTQLRNCCGVRESVGEACGAVCARAAATFSSPSFHRAPWPSLWILGHAGLPTGPPGSRPRTVKRCAAGGCRQRRAPANAGETLPSPCIFTAFVAKTPPLLRVSTAFVAKTPPLLRISTASVAKTPPLLRVSTAFVAKTPPLLRVSTAFVAKTAPFLADIQRRCQRHGDRLRPRLGPRPPRVGLRALMLPSSDRFS